jgi:hypothetical protein
MNNIAAIPTTLNEIVLCAICNDRPTTCTGLYESNACRHEPECEPKLELCSDTVDQPACDECCGHGNEDGHCHPIKSESKTTVKRIAKCQRNDHDWQLVKAKKGTHAKRQVCTACGDAFPCRHACDHLDCRDARIDAETKPNWHEAY